MSELSPGEALRAERVRRRLTLAQAGELLGYSGSTLSRIERGRPVGVEELRRLAARYRIPPVRLGLATVGPTDALDGGDDVLRRELLTGMLGVAGATLLGLPSAGATASGSCPVDVDGLRRRVGQAQADYMACRYSQLATAVPDTIRYAQAVRAVVDGDRRGEVEALAATAYRHATWLALRLGEDGMAVGLSEHAISTARVSGDLLVEAEAAQMGAVVVRRYDQTDRAQELVVGTAARLENTAGLADPRHTAAYAMLLETGAYTAAIAGRRSDALDLHAEATAAVRTTRVTLADRPTPSVVDARFLGLYEISVHRKLGDYGTAIAAARAIRPDSITVTERRVRYYEDVALAYGAWGKREQAFHALLAAEKAAPQEVRVRPWAHRLTRQLRSSGPTLRGLPEFAAHAGVA
ncbi:helix-turn-helix transcriptional regulator [Actinosynnema sp. NPDC050436]|uniref:helix-turn-helix domain-containing protein n=1 Tax=Actinosynnema sp. NPDC050436 TaxID=3155659 RepID=UPI0033E88B76